VLVCVEFIFFHFLFSLFLLEYFLSPSFIFMLYVFLFCVSYCMCGAVRLGLGIKVGAAVRAIGDLIKWDQDPGIVSTKEQLSRVVFCGGFRVFLFYDTRGAMCIV
jgi:hypothetical protein